MRVYIVSDVYPPEPVTSAVIAREIAEELTKRRHDVTVFAPFPNRPAGHLMDGYQRKWRAVEQRDGYRVIHSWNSLSKRSTLISRTAENISFGLTSTLQLVREPRPDVVYMNNWPIFAQWLNTFALSRRQVPVICAVKDLYPETFTEMGSFSRYGFAQRPLRAIDARVYRNSAVITALNPIMAEYIATSRSLDSNRVRVIPDWVDASNFSNPLPKNGDFRTRHGLASDLFLAMYVGAMSRLAGLDLYIQAAEQLRDRKDIRILLVGDGAMRPEIEERIRHKGLDNIQIIHPLLPSDVPTVQAAGDALLMSLLPGAAEHTTPSKLIFYMFSSRPVLASVKDGGPPARIVNDASCGYVIPQGNAHELARRIEFLADNRELLPKFGDNARRYADEHFAKENVLPRMCDLIEAVGSDHADGAADRTFTMDPGLEANHG